MPATVDHAATGEVDDQSPGRQNNSARFHCSRGQIDEKRLAAATLKRELVMKGEKVLFHMVSARLSAPPVPARLGFGDKIQSGPLTCKHDQNTGYRGRLAVANV